jgi:hypothetical protein
MLLCITASLPLFLSAFFLGGRIVVRHVMLEKLEREDLQVIRIHRADLQWYKKGHEIVIDGRMFDVKKIDMNGDTCLVTGLYDDNETALFEQLVITEESRKESSGQGYSLFQSCLGITAVVHPAGPAAFLKPALTSQVHCRPAESRLIQHHYPVVSPPPKSAV